MKSHGYWVKWGKAALVRALKTIAQTAIAAIPVAVSIAEVEWMHVIGTAALAGVLSILTSIAGLPEVEVDVEEEESGMGE